MPYQFRNPEPQAYALDDKPRPNFLTVFCPKRRRHVLIHKQDRQAWERWMMEYIDVTTPKRVHQRRSR